MPLGLPHPKVFSASTATAYNLFLPEREEQIMTTIAFIGLGNMGGPMAANLVKTGFSVLGFDLSSEICKQAAASGITIAASAEAAVEHADIVITMLPEGKHVLAVWRNILPHASPSSLFIDCSTIDVTSAIEAHALARGYSISAIDAPVSGGVTGAQNAALTFMAGGSDEAFGRAVPILAAIGKKTVHCGGPGAGQAAKICNNMLLGISMIGACEAFALGEKLGLSHQALFDVVSTSPGQCWSVTSYCPVPGPVPASPANNAYRPGFAATLMLKDLRLAQTAAAENQAATPLGRQAAELYGRFVETGHAGLDFSAIVDFIRHNLEQPG